MTGKRVLWITERYPPAKGGMSVSCARQVRGLRKRGVLVDVVALQNAVPADRIRATEGGADIRIEKQAPPEAAPNAAWSIVRERHLCAPYDCAVAFGASWPGFLAATFGGWLDIPAVVLVRGNDLDRDWFLPRRGEWVREALSRAAAVGAVSREKADRIARMYPGRPAMWTPNGIDARRWELLEADTRRRDEIRGVLGADRRRIFGLFGDLKYKKRIPFWLEAIRDAQLLDRMAVLVVGNLDTETTAILDDAAIAPPSMRFPFCAPDDLPGYYAACDCVAIPSAFDGMPNVLLEAMACGAVPLVSDAGALGDVVRDGETGFVFRAENRDAAGAATRRAIEAAPEELSAMSRRVKAAVTARFTVDREVDTLIELLASALR